MYQKTGKLYIVENVSDNMNFGLFLSVAHCCDWRVFSSFMSPKPSTATWLLPRNCSADSLMR